MAKPVVYFELGGKDLDAAGSFYASVFDWQITPMPDGSYASVNTGNGSLGGGLTGSDEPGTVISIEVDDIPATLAAIEGKGGSTVIPETVMPGIVTYAVFKDPAGNTLGLIKSGDPA